MYGSRKQYFARNFPEIWTAGGAPPPDGGSFAPCRSVSSPHGAFRSDFSSMESRRTRTGGTGASRNRRLGRPRPVMCGPIVTAITVEFLGRAYGLANANNRGNPDLVRAFRFSPSRPFQVAVEVRPFLLLNEQLRRTTQ